MGTLEAISRNQFEVWPFTVEEGILKCEGGNVTFEANGVEYGVNGQGATFIKQYNGGRDIMEIWAVNEVETQRLMDEGIPKEHATTHMNIGEVLRYGLSLCNKQVLP